MTKKTLEEQREENDRKEESLLKRWVKLISINPGEGDPQRPKR